MSNVLDLLMLRLSEPTVWLSWLLVSIVAFAVARAGFFVLRLKILQQYIRRSLLRGLRLVWLSACVLAWMGVMTYVGKLPQVGVFYELGRKVLLWSQDTAGQILVILAVGLIAWNLIGAVSRSIVPDEEFSRRSVRVATLKNVVQSTLKATILVIGLIAVLQAIGINATSLLAGVSVLGLAVGFGAQSLIKDVFTGFFILLEDQYGVGDYITVNTGLLTGIVENLNLRVTVLRDLDGTVHIIPNGQITTVSVSSKDWSQVVATVRVTYNANIDKALDVLASTSHGLAQDDNWSKYFLEVPDIQGVTKLGDDGITLRALFKVDPLSQWMVQREFNRRIKIAMDEAGIDLPFNQTTVSLRGQPIQLEITEGRAPQLRRDARQDQNLDETPASISQSTAEDKIGS